MPEGFEHSSVAVRAFAEVFARAGAQLGEVGETAGRTAAKAADFGGSWLPHGVEFEKNVAMLADDVGRLARHLRDVSGLLGRATGLVVLPDAVAAMDEALAEVSDAGDCWDVIGRPMRETVADTVPAYDRVLNLNLNPSGPDKRLEIGGLRWGLIELDAARLNGLAAAVDNVFAVVRSVRAGLARGESYEVFRAVEKVEKCLDGYSAAVRTTASGLSTAMVNIRTLYASYRDKCLEILTFGGLLRPDQFRTTDSIGGKLIAEDDLERMRACARRDDAVACDTVTGWAAEHRHNIEKKINEWYRATDDLIAVVRDMYAAALENLRVLAESRVFAALTPPPGVAKPHQSVTLGDVVVLAPDADGHVTITIGDRAYELDFTTAGDVAAPPSAADAEYVSAGSDGRCVIGEPPLTVTAERSLFAPDAVTVVIDDGHELATHTLDFSVAPVAVSTRRSRPTPPRHAAAPVPAAGSEEPDLPVVTADVAAQPPPTAAEDSPAPAGDDHDPGSVFDESTVEPGADDEVAGAAPDEPTVERPGGDARDAPASGDAEPEPAAEPSTVGDAEQSDSLATVTEPEDAESAAEPAIETDALDEAPASPTPEDATDSPGGADVEEAAEKATSGAPADESPSDAEPGAAAVAEEASSGTWAGSVSGVLVPDQPSGEPDTIESGDGRSASGERARAGTGWSVHGDLFETGEPVYSMHGVLGDDDPEGP